MVSFFTLSQKFYLICCSLSHGHSCKKRMATSNVAPPQFSREYRLLKLCAKKGLIFKMS